MKIKVISFCLITSFFLVRIACGVCAEKKVLRVGVIASLTGSQTQIGQALRDGALLAIQHINDGWKDKEARIGVSVADDGARPNQAKDVASQLIGGSR